jgi:hypothetical protein
VKIPAHFGKAKSLQQMYYDLGPCIYNIMMALSKANLVSAFCEANKAKFRVPQKKKKHLQQCKSIYLFIYLFSTQLTYNFFLKKRDIVVKKMS